jgi:hypothetical protein
VIRFDAKTDGDDVRGPAAVKEVPDEVVAQRGVVVQVDAVTNHVKGCGLSRLAQHLFTRLCQESARFGDPNGSQHLAGGSDADGQPTSQPDLGHRRHVDDVVAGGELTQDTLLLQQPHVLARHLTPQDRFLAGFIDVIVDAGVRHDARLRVLDGDGTADVDCKSAGEAE